jgi:hypothetical protein
MASSPDNEGKQMKIEIGQQYIPAESAPQEMRESAWLSRKDLRTRFVTLPKGKKVLLMQDVYVAGEYGQKDIFLAAGQYIRVIRPGSPHDYVLVEVTS